VLGFTHAPRAGEGRSDAAAASKQATRATRPSGVTDRTVMNVRRETDVVRSKILLITEWVARNLVLAFMTCSSAATVFTEVVRRPDQAGPWR